MDPFLIKFGPTDQKRIRIQFFIIKSLSGSATLSSTSVKSTITADQTVAL